MEDILSDEINNERSLLSSLVFCEPKSVNFEKVREVLSTIRSDMLFDTKSKAVYNAINDLCKEDFELLGTKAFNEKLKSNLNKKDPRLNLFLYDLESYWSGLSTVSIWVKKILDFYFTQRYKAASTEEEFEQIIKEKRELIKDVMISDIAEGASTFLEDNYDKISNTAIRTPYERVNKLIGSLNGGDVIILAGSTSSGKTCFMLNLATGAAKQGKKVLIFSLEMPKWQLQQRIICAEAKIDASKFRSFSLTQEDRIKIGSYANNELKKLNMEIFRKQTASMAEIRNTVLALSPDMVFVDYLGLINSYNNKSSYEKFSDISREIKILAMEANVPIMVLHQLNRTFQQRENKRPILSDLRDSGKIEQDADMIWFVYRPALFERNRPDNIIEFILAKDRHGETNQTTYLTFNGKYQSISEPLTA